MRGQIANGYIGHSAIASGAVGSGAIASRTYDAASQLVGIQQRPRVDWLSNIYSSR